MNYCGLLIYVANCISVVVFRDIFTFQNYVKKYVLWYMDVY